MQNKPGKVDFFDFENKFKELGTPALLEDDSLEEFFTLTTSPSPTPVLSTLDSFWPRDVTDEKALESCCNPAAADVSFSRPGNLNELFDLRPPPSWLPEISATTFTADSTSFSV